jgi:hypothetical protein
MNSGESEMVSHFLELPNGIPSHDTFWRVFRTLDPEQFQRCFMRWMAAIQTVTEGEVVASTASSCAALSMRRQEERR